MSRRVETIRETGSGTESLRLSLRSCSERECCRGFALELVSVRVLGGFTLSVTYLVFFFVKTPLKTLVEGKNLKAPTVVSMLFFITC